MRRVRLKPVFARWPLVFRALTVPFVRICIVQQARSRADAHRGLSGSRSAVTKLSPKMALSMRLSQGATSLQVSVHQTGCLVLGAGQQVAVAIERDRGIRVPHKR
jgi:hypothetical protein